MNYIFLKKFSYMIAQYHRNSKRKMTLSIRFILVARENDMKYKNQ